MCKGISNNNNYFVQDCRAGRTAESDREEGTETAVWDGETRSQVNIISLCLCAFETLNRLSNFRYFFKNSAQVRPETHCTQEATWVLIINNKK